MPTFKSNCSIEVHFLKPKEPNLGLVSTNYLDFNIVEDEETFTISTSSTNGEIKISKIALEEDDGFVGKDIIFWYTDREESDIYLGRVSIDDENSFEIVYAEDSSGYDFRPYFYKFESGE